MHTYYSIVCRISNEHLLDAHDANNEKLQTKEYAAASTMFFLPAFAFVASTEH
jgi:hypothetical protein